MVEIISLIYRGGGGGGGGHVRLCPASACIIESKKDWTGQDISGHRRTYVDIDGHRRTLVGISGHQNELNFAK